jgi:chromosome segregation ATPase
MRTFILLTGVMVMVAVAVADAATYEWTDSRGGVHFTDDSDKIPAKYRNKAREVNVTPENVAPSQPQSRIVPPAARESESSYGGHNEMWWRSSFKTLRKEMKNIQENLPRKRDQLAKLRRQRTIYQKPSGRIAYYDMLREIERDEARVTELQKQLAELDTKANKAGVPLGWRQ